MSKPAVTLRKPKPVDTAAAEAFVAGTPAVAAPTPPAPVVRPAGPAKSSAGRTRRKMSVADLERVNAYVPKETMTAVRTRCAVERLSLSEAVTEALVRWIAPPPQAAPADAKRKKTKVG